MSTIINATTTNGVVIQPDNSGSLVLQTNNGTTALTISTAQDTTLAGKLTTASSGIQFSDASIQTAAASPYVLKNRIINGDMRIDQRNAGASVTANGNAVFPVDRWKIEDATDGVFTGQQVSDAPVGASYSLKVTITTADASLGATQYASCYQLIEGYNTADLAWGTANAKTVTLSFWVKSSLTGTFGGSVTNSGWGSTYPFTYTISAANTWEYKTVTIAGSTSGTWLTTNGQGIGLFFGLGVGADYSGTAGAWTTGVKISATGATSVIGTNAATWQIALVQLEIGSTATPFERRLYNQELANCQRYYEKSYTTTTAPNTNTTEGAVIYRGTTQSGNATGNTIFFKVEKRASPTMTFININGTANSWNYDRSGASGTATPATTFTPSTSNATVEVSIGAAWAAAQIYGHYTASAEL